MTNNLLVSVLMSTFNNSANIQFAIESILNQTHKNIELLIMDDGSTDNTYDLLLKMKESYKNIYIFKNSKNIGLTKSLNLLLLNAKGIYIARQDSDDISFLHRIETQLNFSEKKGLDCSFTLALNMENNKVLHKFSNYLPKKLIMKYKNPFVHGSMMIKKDVLIAMGGYDEAFYYSQDYKLYKDLYKSNKKLGLIKIPLYSLNTKNNISSNYSIEQKFYFECARKNIKPKFNENLY